MYVLMALVFILGYLAIALEHPLRVDKSASALLTGVLTWTLFIIGADAILNDHEGFRAFINNGNGEDELTQIAYIKNELSHHLSYISEILFFLLGAMTIVETIDAHNGFSLITNKIRTTHRVKLLWVISILSFFLSAMIDNLTTSIVMVSLLRKLIIDKQERWFFAAFVVVAANAGGAWSPIGDVTTTMLWIGNQLTVEGIILPLFVPSLVCVLAPLLYLSLTMRGHITKPAPGQQKGEDPPDLSKKEKRTVLFLGIGLLIHVPIFKTWTHLPPYMGMLLGVAVIWVVTELMHKNKPYTVKERLSVFSVLKKLDNSSLLFFLGILIAVASLQTAGHLINVAGFLRDSLGNIYGIDLAIGALSAIVDNVPLVAASMGMYSISEPGAEGWASLFVQDGQFWQFLAYCAGTGGSLFIIGSASGVAVMGMERMDFLWYMRKMTLLATLGYLAGAATYYLMYS